MTSPNISNVSKDFTFKKGWKRRIRLNEIKNRALRITSQWLRPVKRIMNCTFCTLASTNRSTRDYGTKGYPGPTMGYDSDSIFYISILYRWTGKMKIKRTWFVCLAPTSHAPSIQAKILRLGSTQRHESYIWFIYFTSMPFFSSHFWLKTSMSVLINSKEEETVHVFSSTRNQQLQSN